MTSTQSIFCKHYTQIPLYFHGQFSRVAEDEPFVQNALRKFRTRIPSHFHENSQLSCVFEVLLFAQNTFCIHCIQNF